MSNFCIRLRKLRVLGRQKWDVCAKWATFHSACFNKNLKNYTRLNRSDDQPLPLLPPPPLIWNAYVVPGARPVTTAVFPVMVIFADDHVPLSASTRYRISGVSFPASQASVTVVDVLSVLRKTPCVIGCKSAVTTEKSDLSTTRFYNRLRYLQRPKWQ